MYAKVRTFISSSDEIGTYNEVTDIVEEAGENNSSYVFKDLSNYSNGNEVQVGWRYYPETDTFAAPPVYRYYAVLNDVNIVINVVASLTEITESNYIEVEENSNVYGMAYINGTFMELEEANYRMLLALTTPTE